MSDLHGETVLLSSDLSSTSSLFPFEDVFKRHGANVVKRSSSLEEIPFALETEQCITAMPEHLSAHLQESNPGSLVCIPIDDAPFHIAIGLLWKKENEKGSIMDYVEAFLAAYRAEKSTLESESSDRCNQTIIASHLP